MAISMDNLDRPVKGGHKKNKTLSFVAKQKTLQKCIVGSLQWNQNIDENALIALTTYDFTQYLAKSKLHDDLNITIEQLRLSKTFRKAFTPL